MKSWLLFLSLLISVNAWCDDIHYNQVSLTVNAKEQVKNDLLTTTLYTQHEGNDPAVLASKVNADMNWALEIAGKVSNVDHQTLSYSSKPIYTKSHITGWRVRQSLLLKSADNTGLSQLIGKLQSRLAVQSVSYQISDTLRKQAENKLITGALKNFEERARLVAKQLNRTSYKLVKLDINTGSPIQPRAYMSAMATREDAAVPRLEPGTQEVTITIHGTIALSPD